MTVPGPLDLVMGWRDDPSVTPTELLILMILRAHRSRDGRCCNPSRDTLAAEAHVTPRTVRRALSAWVARGVISPDGRRAGGRSRATNWRWQDPSEWCGPFRTPPQKGDPGVPVTAQKGDPGVPVTAQKGDPGVPVTAQKGDPGDTKRGILVTLKGDPGVPRTGRNREREQGSPPNPPAGGAPNDREPEEDSGWREPPAPSASEEDPGGPPVPSWLPRPGRCRGASPADLVAMVTASVEAVTGQEPDPATLGTDARPVLILWRRLEIPTEELPEQLAMVTRYLVARGDPRARSLRHVTDPARWGDRLRAAREAELLSPPAVDTTALPPCAVCHGDLEVDCGATRIPCPWCVRPEVHA